MSYYVPIFAKIVDSSLWAEPDFVVKVFITMLAKKDKDNVCRGSAFNIARWSNKTEEEVLEALKILASPDTKRVEPQAYDGRRIEKVADGWMILNGEVYQKMMREANRKQYLTEKQREYRSALPPAPVNPPAVPPAGEEKPAAESKRKPKSLPAIAVSVVTRPFREDLLTPRLVEKWQVWKSVRGAMKKPKDWKVMFEEQMEFLERYPEPVAFEILSASIRNGWQGLFAPKEGTGANGTVLNPGNLRTIIEAKKTKAAELRTRYCSDTAIDAIWNDDNKRQEFFTLKKEIKNLTNQLSNMA